MTKDAWAIIGTMMVIGAIIVSLGAVGINQLETRIEDLRTDANRGIDDVRQNVASLATEVRRMGAAED